MWVTVDHTTDADSESAPSVCFKIWALKDFTDHTQSGVATDDYGPGAEFENVSKILPRCATTPIEHVPQVIQNSTNVPLAVEPMSPYQIALRLEVETLFGTAPVAPLVPSVCSAIPFAV